MVASSLVFPDAVSFSFNNRSVSITDNGIGISPERIDTIFDKASYETTFGTKLEKGAGLGLKLCQEFIERHNGKIWVESELGKGSKFYFLIPK